MVADRMTLAPCPTPRCPSRPALKWADLHGTGVNIHGWQIMCEACGASGPVCSEGPEDERAERALMAWNKMSQNCGAS